ncbi:DUF2249 domain-containing protein [Daejeonella lutea]|uniref:DUF2249 domain-containing protein n=1 Tax=Daejeonella lutea TaxID=572036 RepID=A0A1T5A4W8_9SPHI|nr:DUF2249 domain-containing protein [Daejeonella lutea]SKB29879.1 protein of unknown function [Daejeonella lutea]
MKTLPINGKTKISTLIKANPLVIDTLADFNPHFRKLKNPVLRNLLTSRVNIFEACRIGGCDPEDFMAKMSSLGFEIENSIHFAQTGIVQSDSTNSAAGLKVLELDVRPLLAEGNDPLKAILAELKAMKTDECLKVINTFEPIPLISLLKKQGFNSWTQQEGPGLVNTFFLRSSGNAVPTQTPVLAAEKVISAVDFDQKANAFRPERLHTIDVRDLEMPQPMIRILEELQVLKKDEALFVYHKKLPVYLLPELADRGYTYYTEDSSDGKLNMLIYKV